MRVSLGVLLLGALAFGDEPLPVGRSATLSAGTYVLAGNEHLPKGVRLICKPGVRIIGKGKGKLLMIEGTFETQGVKGAEVVFENVWLQPYHTFQRIRLSFARFKGKGGIYTPTDREARGKLHLEDVWFQDEACIWVKFHMGKIEAKRVSSADSCRIEGTHSDRNLSVDISECFHETDLVSGFHGGLSVYNVKDVQIRSTRFGGSGATSRFHNCTRLLLEGCKFDSRALLVRHHKRARFKKTKILKCDFYSKFLLFESPKGGKDRVTLDNCFFGGDAGTKPVDIVKNRTSLGKNVRVVVKAPSGEPHNLAGTNRPR